MGELINIMKKANAREVALVTIFAKALICGKREPRA